MKRYFSRTFFRFLFGFLVIIVAAFVVLALAGMQQTSPVDNIAQPQ